MRTRQGHMSHVVQHWQGGCDTCDARGTCTAVKCTQRRWHGVTQLWCSPCNAVFRRTYGCGQAPCAEATGVQWVICHT